MELDLHIHTHRYSGCSNIPPEKLLQQARAAGLDGIAITEHGIRWSDRDIAELKDKAGMTDFTVIAGQEIACYGADGRFEGEFLVFGYPQSLGSSKSARLATDIVHAAGGVMIAAHPFKRMKNGSGFYGSGLTTLEIAVDGLEVEHPDYDGEGRSMARILMKSMGVAGIGASDAHELRHVGRCRTVFERNITTCEMLCEEIRRCRLQAVRNF